MPQPGRRRLSDGGQIVEDLQARPWGASAGQVIDRHGVHGLIGFEGDDSEQTQRSGDEAAVGPTEVHDATPPSSREPHLETPGQTQRSRTGHVVTHHVPTVGVSDRHILAWLMSDISTVRNGAAPQEVTRRRQARRQG